MVSQQRGPCESSLGGQDPQGVSGAGRGRLGPELSLRPLRLSLPICNMGRSTAHFTEKRISQLPQNKRKNPKWELGFSKIGRLVMGLHLGGSKASLKLPRTIATPSPPIPHPSCGRANRVSPTVVNPGGRPWGTGPDEKIPEWPPGGALHPQTQRASHSGWRERGLSWGLPGQEAPRSVESCPWDRDTLHHELTATEMSRLERV